MGKFTWNDLLIKILDMTPEDRRKEVCYNDGEMYSEPSPVVRLECRYGENVLSAK